MVKNKKNFIAKLAIASILFSTVVYPIDNLVVDAKEVSKPPVTKDGIQYYVTDAKTVTILGYSKTSKNVKLVIPAKIGEYPVTEIQDNAFKSKSIISVKFSDNLKKIGDSAFTSNQLKEVVFPSTLTEIGKDAFRANVITKVTFNKGLTKIGDNAFQANLLKNFDLPTSVKEIGEGVFYYNVGYYEGEDESKVEVDKDFYEQDKIKVDVTNGNITTTTPTTPNGSTNKPNDGENQTSLDLGLEGGELTLITPKVSSFKVGPVKLTKEPIKTKVTFSNEVTVSDLRATGEGWHLTVQASQFSEVPVKGGVPPKGGWHKFPTGSIMLTGETKITPIDTKNTSTPPTSTTGSKQGGFAIDSGAVTVASAYYYEGMGEWKLTFPSDALTLTTSSDYAKSDKVNYPNKPTPYASTITWTLVSGPGI